MGTLDRIVTAVDWLGRILISAGIAIIAITMVAQVFFRYVLNDALQWSDELAVYVLVWTVFIGSFMLIRNWEHITITVFVNMLPFRGRAIMFIVAKSLCVIFIGLAIYYGFEMIVQAAHRNSPSLGFSTRWVKLSIPVSAVLMAVFIVNELVRDYLALKRRDAGHFDRLGLGGSL